MQRVRAGATLLDRTDQTWWVRSSGNETTPRRCGDEAIGGVLYRECVRAEVCQTGEVFVPLFGRFTNHGTAGEHKEQQGRDLAHWHLG